MNISTSLMHLRGSCGLLLAAVVFQSTAYAQTPAPSPQLRQQLDRQINTSRDRIEVPLPSTPNFDLRLQAPEKSALPKAIDELRFEVKGFEFDGLNRYPRAEVDPLFADLLNQTVTLEQVRLAAQALEQKYRADGYFLSRVFIPPQRVENGIFSIRVVEGQIAQVFVEGNNEAVSLQVQAMAQRLTTVVPIDLASLERVLLLMNDIPGAKGAGVLRQGAQEGTTDLLVTLEAAPDLHLLSINNTGSNITGPIGVSYNTTVAQPLGLNGALAAGITGIGSRLEEVQSVNVRYSTALGSDGLQASLGALSSRALPGGSLKALDIRSDSVSISPRLRYPLIRTRASSVYLDGGLSVNRSLTTLAASTLTYDRSTVADVGTSWVLDGWGNGTQSLGLTFFKGLSAFDASKAGDANTSVAQFDPGFTKYVMSFQRTQNLANNFSVLVLANAQYSQDKMLAGESIAFGGPALGRGFDAATISGDKGYGVLAELRYNSESALFAEMGPVQYYFSVDDASTRTVGTTALAAESNHISSSAVGVRFSLFKNALVDLQVANGHKKITGPDVRSNPRFLISVVIFF
jgi:hemolysin activation/secretion protein